MTQTAPIYTVTNECQDCYKCVRHCPVKAIRVADHHASIVPELCVSCGNCVQICPARAKRVRDDRPHADDLLRKKPVFVSLAPSWVTEFPDVAPTQMIAALKALGFAGVSETALGAQQVSTAVAEQLREEPFGLFISSACPAGVEFIRKYTPEYTEDILAMKSPVLCHAQMLKQEFGSEVGIVLISPCIAKKTEADAHPELLDFCLTFQDLHHWFADRNIDPKLIKPAHADRFLLSDSEEGALYPIEGGMIDSIHVYPETDNIQGITLSGLSNIDKALSRLNVGDVEDVLMVELLACDGGCVNGPCMKHQDASLLSRVQVAKHATMPPTAIRRQLEVDIHKAYAKDAQVMPQREEPVLRDALRRVGKQSKDDELNCGGCGYDSCLSFAAALLDDKAEPPMCVSYLRIQAQKKANALLRCMPSAVVIADADLNVVECNKAFVGLCAEEVALAYDARPGLSGAKLRKLLPFSDMFETVLRTGEDQQRVSYRMGDRLLDLTIFSIEDGQTVGAVIVDVTNSEQHRDQIARRAEKVIEKNLTTVQEIACMLGEHMADTEILLRDIADGYAGGKAKG